MISSRAYSPTSDPLGASTSLNTNASHVDCFKYPAARIPSYSCTVLYGLFTSVFRGMHSHPMDVFGVNNGGDRSSNSSRGAVSRCVGR